MPSSTKALTCLEWIFDRMVKVAAAGIASRLICTSLNIKSEEERYRFGFAA